MYDTGSGINFKIKNFLKILEYSINNKLELVITYKDRLYSIGYDPINYLFKNITIRIIHDCKKV